MKKVLATLLAIVMLVTAIPLGKIEVSAENLIDNGYFQYSTYGWNIHTYDEEHDREYPGKTEAYISCEAAHHYQSSTADEQGVHIVGHGCSDTLFSQTVETEPGKQYEFYAEYKVADYEEHLWEQNLDDTTALTKGTTFQLGYYPRNRVTDSAQIKKLNAYGGEWKSLNMSTKVGRVYCTDIVCGEKKYRGIRIAQARNGRHELNGYSVDEIYWFEYAPINWILLDATTGLAVSAEVIDAQAFHHTGDKVNDSYANNYEKSDIRKWLLTEFVSTAFTMGEEKLLLTKLIDNSAVNFAYSSAHTRDNVFLLSRNEFNSYNFSKTSSPSEYAKAMSVDSRYWNLRTAGSEGFSYYYVTNGRLDRNIYDDAIFVTSMGVRPAIYVDVANYRKSVYKTEKRTGSGMYFSIDSAGYYGNTTSGRNYYTEFLESKEWDSIRVTFVAKTTKTAISFIGSGCGADSESKESIYLDDVRMYESEESTIIQNGANTQNSYTHNGEQAYIHEHVDFINSALYRSSVENLRFGKTVAESRDSTIANAAYFAYDIIEGAMELISFQEISSLKNPYDAVLLDLLADKNTSQFLAELSENATYNSFHKLVKNLKALYDGDSDWSSELADVEAFKQLNKLDPDNWTSNKTYQALDKLLKNKTKGSMDQVLDCLDTYKVTLDYLDVGLTGIKYFMEAMRIAVAVEAYAEATDTFKAILAETATAMMNGKRTYGAQFREAYERYSSCISSSEIAETVALYVLDRGGYVIVELSNKIVKDSAYTYCTAVLGMSAAAATTLVATLWAAEVGFGIGNMITNMGDEEGIANCNRMIRACYHLEEAVYTVMSSHANKLRSSATYQEAAYFDESFNLFASVQKLALNYYRNERKARASSFLAFCVGRKNLYKSEAQALADIIDVWKNITCHSGDYSGSQTCLVACPTNVYVYDKQTGELVASVIDNVIENTIEDRLTVVVEENDKAISAPDLSLYDVRVEATDNGTMKVAYSENALSGDYQNRTVEFNDVPLTSEDTFAVVRNLETDDFSLNRGENETMAPDVDTLDLVMEVVKTAVTENGLSITCRLDGNRFVAEGYTEPCVEITTSAGKFVATEYTEEEGQYVFVVPNVVAQSEDWLHATLVASKNGETYAGNAHVFMVQDSVLFEVEGSVLAHYPVGKAETTYEVPGKVEYIKEGAFVGCDLTEIILPRQTFFYGANAFAECETLSVVYFGGDETDREALFIEGGNEALENAVWHYNYVDPTSHFSKNVQHSVMETGDAGLMGLAFRFQLSANNVAVQRSNIVDCAAATINYKGKLCRLVGMGAVVTNQTEKELTLESVNGRTVIDIPTVYLSELGDDYCAFATRIINIPETQWGSAVYARPYYIVDVEDEQIVIYGDVDVASCAEYM